MPSCTVQPHVCGGTDTSAADASRDFAPTRDLVVRISDGSYDDDSDDDSKDAEYGYVSVSPFHTLADVRAMIKDEFDDDMLPGGGGRGGVGDKHRCFFKLDGRVRVSSKQEQTKLAWDLFREDGTMKVRLSIHARSADGSAEARPSKRKRGTPRAKAAPRALSLPLGSPRVVAGDRKKKKRDGTYTNYSHQGACSVCKMQTTTVCSDCTNERGFRDVYVCDPIRTKKACWETHLAKTKHDRRASGRRKKQRSEVEAAPQPHEVRSLKIGSPGLIPSRRKKVKSDGTVTSQTRQGRCAVCKHYATTVCSHCTETNDRGDLREVYLCDPFRTGRTCLETHIGSTHGVGPPAEGDQDDTDLPKSSAPILTQSSRKKKKKDGTVTNHTHQGNCAVCKKSASTVCSGCNDTADKGGKRSEVFVCDPLRTKRACWETHLRETHLEVTADGSGDGKPAVQPERDKGGLKRTLVL